jgi:uncharacterized protein
MAQPNYDLAKNYVRTRLESELPVNLTYHCIAHTFSDVLPAAERLAQMLSVSEENQVLLRTAVLFHDLGFVESATNHENIGIRIARQVLPRFGYSPEQVETIDGIILATRLPQAPHNLLEYIIADADLDVFGRDDFVLRNQALRTELESQGRVFFDEEWYSDQIEFMQNHTYFTEPARKWSNVTKAQNLLYLRHKLAAVTGQEKSPDQISLPERVAILRTVSLFAETPDNVLEEIALLLRPQKLAAGQTIFHKGEAGDCMFMIVRGRMRIHDGEMLLNHLGPGDVFGEMALLDDQPRVASATAAEGSALFELSQEAFYELMSIRSEVALGIIRVLNHHLRRRVHDQAADFHYIQQVGRVTAAAAALEAGIYDGTVVDEVCQRQDELGQLARVFQKMANEVQAREQRLKQELMELRIQVDEAKRAQAVAEITETDYFQTLEMRVGDMRRRRKNRQMGNLSDA